MGSGKTSAAINFINAHPKEKFVYVTPYLTETERIRDACPELKFVCPSNRIPDYNFKKINHTEKLISLGKNVSTTHQSFMSYTKDMLKNIQEQGYILIIDENINYLSKFNYSLDDLDIAMRAGYIKCENGKYSLGEREYHGQMYQIMFRLLASQNIYSTSRGKTTEMFYWTLPAELVTSFKDVYILTYLFEGQSLKYFLKMNDIPYKFIGVKGNKADGFFFTEDMNDCIKKIPGLKDKIHILENSNLNKVGEDKFALSKTWFTRNSKGVNELQKNLYNYFNNIHRGTDPSERMWGSFNSGYAKLKGKGYTKSFVVFNSRATNEYRHKTILAYATNVFMDASEFQFYQQCGIKPDAEAYALSTLVQWVWRSAIREGKEIHLYLPSSRMRELLTAWIDDVSC